MVVNTKNKIGAPTHVISPKDHHLRFNNYIMNLLKCTKEDLLLVPFDLK